MRGTGPQRGAQQFVSRVLYCSHHEVDRPCGSKAGLGVGCVDASEVRAALLGQRRTL